MVRQLISFPYTQNLQKNKWKNPFANYILFIQWNHHNRIVFDYWMQIFAKRIVCVCDRRMRFYIWLHIWMRIWMGLADDWWTGNNFIRKLIFVLNRFWNGPAVRTHIWLKLINFKSQCHFQINFRILRALKICVSDKLELIVFVSGHTFLNLIESACRRWPNDICLRRTIKEWNNNMT